ncbi:MAG: hypothetical protein KDD61_04665 [Bdellovibrionales bacterium]|nr:hypothetical protein [Bdellovibrionales bacterium]
MNNHSEFPLNVEITDAPALVAFSSSFGILDFQKKSAVTYLPVTVRNVETKLLVSEPSASSQITASAATQKYGFSEFSQVVSWLKKVSLSPASEKSELGAQKRDFQVPLIEKNKKGESVPLQVVGIPLQGKGFFVTEVLSPKLASSQKVQKNQTTPYIRTTSLVTDLVIHLKQGNDSSLIWVTDLKSGKPVSGAQVSLADCKGEVRWSGSTSPLGVTKVDAQLGQLITSQCVNDENRWSANRYDQGFFVVAKKGDDFSFTHSSWNDGITPWRFGVPADYSSDIHYPKSNIVIHGVFDRPLYRSGEEVYVKYLARKKVGDGFVIPEKNLLPTEYSIEDPLDGKQIHNGKLKWDAQRGEVSVSWVIPKDALVGSYYINLSEPKSDKYYGGGQVQVSQFKVPNMKGQLQLTAKRPFPSHEVDADFLLGYSNGGPAQSWPVQLSYTVSEVSDINVKEYDWMAFANGSYQKTEKPAPSQPKTVTKNMKLDQNGSGHYTIDLTGYDLTKPYVVQSELIYRDSNGEVNTLYSKDDVWPASHIVGLKGSQQPAKMKQLRFNVAVVNSEKKSAFNEVEAPQFFIYREETYSVSRRIPGGFYEQESHTVLTPVTAAVTCGKDLESPLFLDCQMTVNKGGDYIVEAQISKNNQVLSTAHTRLFASSKDPNDFAPEITKSDRIDLIPDKKEYRAGELARFQLKTPFAKGQVLVTVEREGVMEHFVKTVSRSQPFFELKVKKSWTPNAFISAVAVRGRAGEGPKQVGAIDLNKPSFKMGLTQIKVNWDVNRLDMKVTTVGDTFRPRQKVKTNFIVRRSQDGKVAAKSRLIVAMVDESLLEIKSNDSWNLLEKMMRERSLQVFTSTGKLQIVGRRHFGLKATPHGGGGGMAPTRELFNTLAYWNDQVETDENGVANLEIPIHSDSLTTFRIVAVGYQGSDLFGTGSTTIRTAIDVMVQSGMPAVLRDRDRIVPDFTLRNTTKESKELSVQVDWRFSTKGTLKSDLRQSQKVTLGSESSARIQLSEVSVPEGTDRVEYTLTLLDKNGKVVDRVKQSIPIYESVEVVPTMAALEQLEFGKEVNFEIARPQDSLKGRGGIEVRKSATLIGSLSAFEEFKRLQKFEDMESRLAVAVSDRDASSWSNLIRDIEQGQYLDDRGLVKLFKLSQNGSAWLTSLVMIAAKKSKQQFDKSIEEKILNAVREQFQEGRGAKSQSLPGLIRMARALALYDAISESEIAGLESLNNGPENWKLSEVLDWMLSYKEIGSANYTRAKSLSYKKVKEQMVFQGRAAVLPTSSAIYYENDRGVQAGWIDWYLQETSDFSKTKDTVIIPLTLGLVNSLKQTRGYWPLATSNIWSFYALNHFAQVFEQVPAQGITELVWKESGGTKTTKHLLQKSSGELGLPWPEVNGDLTVKHKGQGAPWLQLLGSAALALKDKIEAGFYVESTVRKTKGNSDPSWKIGDVYQVDYKVKSNSSVPSARVFIPIPSGATILSSHASHFEDFRQETYEGYRGVFSSLRAGETVTITLNVRLNNAGLFRLPSAQVQSVYSPEMRYVSPVSEWTVSF